MLRPATTNCPICFENGKFALRIGDHEIAECSECAHRYLDAQLSSDHTDRHYVDEYFDGGGAGYTDYLAQESLVTSYGRRYANIVKRHVERGKLLDVGSAAGFFMKGFQECGWEVTGIEPNQSMAAEAMTRFGFKTINAAIEEYDVSSTFDLVTFVQVIAHFRDLPRALEKSAKALRPGGFLLVETWNFKSLPAEIFGSAWHEYSPPTVVNWFSPQSLNELMRRSNLRRVGFGRPRKRVTARHAASLIGHSIGRLTGARVPSSLLSSIPESIVLPYPSFDVFWALYRMDAGVSNHHETNSFH